MISEADILLLHEFSARDYGGAKEIRDRTLLLSAIARPFPTFDGQELYPTIFEKAAALGESLIINHPFMDGNKRTAFLAMLSLLKEHEKDFSREEHDVYHFIISMSTGESNFDEIVAWLESGCR